MPKSKQKRKLEGTVYIASHKSILKENRPEIFLEAHEFYSRPYYARVVANQNNMDPNRTCKWDVIAITFKAEIEAA